MQKKLITWGVIFVLSFIAAAVVSIEQGLAFLWTYIVVSLVCAAVNAVNAKIKGYPGEMVLTVLWMCALVFVIGFGLAAIISCGIAALIKALDFYIVFQIVTLVLCFIPIKINIKFS